MIWQFLFGGVRALFASLWLRLTGPKKPTSTTEAEHALAAKQREAEVFSAPLPDDSALDAIVREHNRKV